MTIQTITPSFAKRNRIHALRGLQEKGKTIYKRQETSMWNYLNKTVCHIQLVFDNDGDAYRKSRRLAIRLLNFYGNPFQMQTPYGSVPVKQVAHDELMFNVHTHSEDKFTLYTHKTAAWNEIFDLIKSEMERIQRGEGYMDDNEEFDMKYHALYPAEKDWLVSHWIEKHMVNVE